MAIRMIEQHRRRGVHSRQAERPTLTLVWDGSILYVFRGSIAQAHLEGAAALRAQVFPQGSGVSDVPLEGASVVWMDDTPYLFPDSLTDASGRGKGLKRQWVYLQRVARQSAAREAAAFERMHPGL